MNNIYLYKSLDPKSYPSYLLKHVFLQKCNNKDCFNIISKHLFVVFLDGSSSKYLLFKNFKRSLKYFKSVQYLTSILDKPCF